MTTLKCKSEDLILSDLKTSSQQDTLISRATTSISESLNGSTMDSKEFSLSLNELTIKKTD
jgi:hypothetical protein